MSTNQKKIAELEKKNSDLQKQLSEINLQGMNFQRKGERISLYIYPNGWNKEKINSEEGKKWRDAKRRKIQSFANNIFYYKECNNMQSLLLEISSFDKFYAEFYSLNDYSLHSISNAKNDAKLRNVEMMLKIIMIVKGNNQKEEKKIVKRNHKKIKKENSIPESIIIDDARLS